jgi:cyclic 2,3-diphosphoglycerate synthetase
LVVLTMAEEPLASTRKVEALRSAIAEVRSDLSVLSSVLRPRPIEPVAGRRVAFFSTAPVPIHARLREHLEREHGAEVTLVSGNLARREELRAELDSPAARTAEVYLVEIKAAAIDVVVEAAADREVPVVFSDNEVLTLPGEEPLDERLAALADAAVGEKVPA